MNCTQFVRYRGEEDQAFLPTEVFSPDMFVPGLAVNRTDDGFMLTNNGGATGCYVIAGQFATCYEVKFPESAGVTLALAMEQDPRMLQAGETITLPADACRFDPNPELIQYQPGRFMFVCRKQPEYLVIAISGEPQPLSVGQRFMLCPEDTSGPWFYPNPVGTLTDPDGTFGNFQWNAATVMEKLYEPYRAKYPEYISRTFLGKDQSGEYDMYGYVFAPPTWKTTMFLTSGVHGNEESAYFSLAKLLQLISDAGPDSELLYTLRCNVRFIVVPIVNVWGTSQNHSDTEAHPRKRIRKNSQDVDLNRDFGETTQQESKNVLNFFRNYAKEIDIVMDFHNSKAEGYSMWYNFINYSVNSQANYKTTNHMYHRLVELGLCEKAPNIRYIPGSYVKQSMYVEGRFWNEFQVPTITVEHIINSTFPHLTSSEGLTLGVETFGNFVIQNALFFMGHNQKEL